jgi:hypothetical protein
MQPIIMPMHTTSTREGLDVILSVCKLGLSGLARAVLPRLSYTRFWLSRWIIDEHLGWLGMNNSHR